ncbi:MAG: hypothetical protein R3183_03750 [Oleiphilaceae bacterium]|nr:hypothetical protein [Oleiphilaceae bacterium]
MDIEATIYGEIRVKSVQGSGAIKHTIVFLKEASKSIMKKWILIILPLLIVSCANTQKIERERVIASTWMPASESDQDRQLASAFGLTLAYWVDKYGTPDELPDGEFIPTFFALELAFKGQLSYWSHLALENRSSNTYMEALEKVNEAGFLSEYIWAYHSHPSWGKPEPSLKTNEFKKWAASNLVGHQPRIESRIELSWKEI